MHRREEIHLLSSLAVFGQTYKNNENIIDAIAAFSEATIVKRNLKSFTCSELTRNINEEFSFTLPEGVIATSLKRINHLEKTKEKPVSYIYTPSEEQETSNRNLLLRISEAEEKNSKLLLAIQEYIELKLKRILSNHEIEELSHSFTSFMQDNANGKKFSEHISAFIISKSEDSDFIEHIQEIKDGSIIEAGIRFNNNISDTGAWKQKITIILGTEIIFHLAGYNGDVFKQITEEFLSYITEINSAKQDKIKLRYFSETLEEVNLFFSKAEDIVSGKDKALPHLSAMVHLTNGCNDRLTLLTKKQNLARLLQVKKIKLLEDEDFFSEANHQYNIINSSISNQIQAEMRHEIKESHLKELNYINILRKGDSQRFDNITHILVTENYKMLSIAWSPLLKDKGNVPLATNLNFMISKFWFKLNRGFGSQIKTVAFDVITKAKIVLSSKVNESVSKRLDELKSDFANGRLDKETATGILADCRSDVRRPEEITSEETEQILSLIEDSSIDAYIRNKVYFESLSTQREVENANLTRKLETEIKNKKEITTSLIAEKKLSKKLYIEKITTEKEKLNTIKIKREHVESRYVTRKKMTTTISIVLIAAITFSASYYASDEIEKITKSTTYSALTLLLTAFIWFTKDKLTPQAVQDWFSEKHTNYLNVKLTKLGLDKTTIKQSEDFIQSLEMEVSSIENDIISLESVVKNLDDSTS
ncbi:hypothetical protein SAMN05660691_04187 [Rheinheimera pacifica]|uniref:Uncharacterized protein n=1 Tax=Rheinheimera pacifica TaxID=173990 RepID=A0A1H6NTA2_9GAMM|nr:hypothetical protein [Rheinheimera pacifica]SEI14289.1 hypothetical protein SAMN05660691_04187 [Rheinheimera pacifica]